MLIYMYSEMGNLLAYSVLKYVSVCLCLCQLEGLDVNPLQSNCTATLNIHKLLFLKYILYTDLFLWLYFVWNSFHKDFGPIIFVHNVC